MADKESRMKGFKDFVFRGNLVELAVAFVMAAAFAKVVTTAVTVLMDLVGKAGGTPDFSNYRPYGIHIGDFLTAVVAFLVMAAVVYFLVVLPYTKARDVLVRRDQEAPTSVPDDVALLTEIRDLLRAPGSQR
jgi:large conductance mechanosensitive channel